MKMNMSEKTRKNLIAGALAAVIFACGFGGGYALCSVHKPAGHSRRSETAMQQEMNKTEKERSENAESAQSQEKREKMTSESVLAALSDEQKQQLMDSTGKSEEELKAMDVKELIDAMHAVDIHLGKGKNKANANEDGDSQPSSENTEQADQSKPTDAAEQSEEPAVNA